ncbi:hypothetical protein A1O3_05787 [Capronia epimyces CBS 606.96]|uniref:PNPLA domain-containing protein n=1 Tax=Capronia epimyces CBS 606.96 TaxID=1182542 RepID=W9XX14_9EURO|nr:uncharacterized protein A1O3_05787 [Capronia epimyces CBS 606.96]EXJ85112.1 hypothetical protein A1O3_05787 [Capronia epimyces CBS 606.96]
MRQLLTFVTQEVIRRGAIPENHPTLNPQDIFDAAVGTSTGGLIVLMLVKLDMTLEECIRQYKVLSGDIFSKYRCLVRRVFGSDWSKFSGMRLQRAVEKLLASRGHPLDMKLRGSVQHNQMHGTVLCHEKLRGHQMFLCTHQCTGPYQRHTLEGELELRHAARATSAAPSYFEPMIIQGKLFVDGGYGDTNNPSWAAKIHYHQSHGLPARHPLVLINIGTGTLPEGYDEVRLLQRPWWTRLLPNSLVEALGLLSDLVKMATESEHRAADLAYIAAIAPEKLFFQRFSADTGMHDIRLDKWQAVTDRHGRPSEIEVKTETYLAKPDVQMHLRTAAKKLAEVYIARNNDPSIRLPLPIHFPLGPEPPCLTQAMLGSQPSRATQPSPSLVAESGSTPSSTATVSPSPSPSPSPPATPDPYPKSLFYPQVGSKTGDILRVEGRFFEMPMSRATRARTR